MTAGRQDISGELTYVPSCPGGLADTNGFTPEDWLPNQLALTATRPFQADPSNSLTTLGTVTGCQWRFVDLDDTWSTSSLASHPQGERQGDMEVEEGRS